MHMPPAAACRVSMGMLHGPLTPLKSSVLLSYCVLSLAIHIHASLTDLKHTVTVYLLLPGQEGLKVTPSPLQLAHALYLPLATIHTKCY